MISKNDATLEFYEQSADLYGQRNLKDYSSGRGQAENAKHRRFIASSLEGVSKDAVLFESVRLMVGMHFLSSLWAIKFRLQMQLRVF